MNRFIESPSTIDVSKYLLPKLKESLRILDITRDAELSGLLSLSQILVEKYTWRYLTERQVLGEFNNFTHSRANDEWMLDCRKAPIFDGALISITFKSDTGDEVLAGRLFEVNEFGECFLDANPIGDADEKVLYPVQVVFKAGYKEDANGWACPLPLQQGVVLLAAYMFNNPMICSDGGCSCAGKSSNGINLPSQVSLMLEPFILRRYDDALFI